MKPFLKWKYKTRPSSEVSAKKTFIRLFTRGLEVHRVVLTLLLLATFFKASAQLELKIEAIPGIGMGGEYRLVEGIGLSISGMYWPEIANSQKAQAFNQTHSPWIQYAQTNLCGTAIVKWYFNEKTKTESFIGPYYRVWRQQERISNISQWTNGQYQQAFDDHVAKKVVIEKATIGVAMGGKMIIGKEFFCEMAVGVGFSPNHFWQKITRINDEFEFSPVPPDYLLGHLNKVGGFFQLGIGYQFTER